MILDDGGGSGLGLGKRLADIGVMPVVRFYRHQPNPGSIGGREVSTAAKYVSYGIRYFQTNNEPDSQREWSKPMPDNWLSVVVDNFIVDAYRLLDVGGIPLFPPFSFGGGRDNPLVWLPGDILNNMVVAIHNYGLGRPIRYPNDNVNMYGTPLALGEWEWEGGQWAWELPPDKINEQRANLANPQASIAQDFTCFRAFEKFDEWVRQAAGRSIPIMTTEGGWNVGERAPGDVRYPRPTPERASFLDYAAYHYIATAAPDYYFTNMVWLVACEQIGVAAVDYEMQGPFFTHLYDKQFGLNGSLPIVEMLKAQPIPVRVKGSDTLKKFGVGLAGTDVNESVPYLEPELSIVRADAPGAWRLTHVGWSRLGRGETFVRALDEARQPLAGIPFAAFRGDATDLSITKGPVDAYWGNISTRGALGTYDIYIANATPSDTLKGVGSGLEDGTYYPTEFYLVFEKGKQMPFNYKAYRASYIDDPSNDAGGYGVTIARHTPLSGEWYWKIQGVYHLLPDENLGGHYLYLDAVTPLGTTDRNVHIDWGWEGMAPREKPGLVALDKADYEPPGNIAMWAEQRVWAKVPGNSDVIQNVHTGHADEAGGNTWGHHSFYVLWQYVQAPELPPPPSPPPPNEWEEQAKALLGEGQECLEEVVLKLGSLLTRLREFNAAT